PRDQPDERPRIVRDIGAKDEQGAHQLQAARLGPAKVEIVHAEPAEEHPQQISGKRTLARGEDGVLDEGAILRRTAAAELACRHDAPPGAMSPWGDSNPVRLRNR